MYKVDRHIERKRVTEKNIIVYYILGALQIGGKAVSGFT